jgi:DNA-binding MurR/RpiR family transcriptional regulator
MAFLQLWGIYCCKSGEFHLQLWPILFYNTYAILFAKKKGVYVITISDSELSDVASESDIVLATQTQIPSFFNSYIVPMELCNIILISILEKNKERIYKNLKNSIEDSEEFNLYI